MDSLWSEALKSYGLLGLIIVFAIATITMILRHFMESSNRKDEQINKITSEFSDSLRENTKALYSISGATDRLHAWLEDKSQASHEEHAEILSFVRGARR